MQRCLAAIIISMIMAIGCAARIPVAPDTGRPGPQNQQSAISASPHRLLWGEYQFFINAAHDKVDVVPMREGRFHLNALKFLESYCSNCLKITGIKNNGDSTIDLTVKITHPFPGYREYTGFDVKGIIMFNGSHLLTVDYHGDSPDLDVPLPHPTRLSWREMGDPEVLNADGYSRRWSPSYQSGSSLPMFNYWKGKYANGEPTADVNAFLNFYTKEERHMFEVNSSVSKTYKIWLLKDNPVVAGYAVEACWEPPTVRPVTNPLTDFPSSANQPEAYYVKWIVNNGEPIKQGSANQGAFGGLGRCDEVRVEIQQWGGVTSDAYCMFNDREPWYLLAEWLVPCDPPQDGILSIGSPWAVADEDYAVGKYQWLGSQMEQHWPDYSVKTSFSVLEFEVIE